MRDKDIDARQRWRDVKSTLRDEPRYHNGALRSDEREKLFEEYIAERRRDDADPTERQRRSAARLEAERARVQAARDAEIARARASHLSTDAEDNFMALCVHDCLLSLLI